MTAQDVSVDVASSAGLVSAEKRARGQFFTMVSPFQDTVFQDWLAQIPDHMKQIILEPFAGAGNITRMLPNNHWACFDIQPRAPFVVMRDTIANFPVGYDVAITNPPFLYRSSAKRSKTPYPDTDCADLYELCLIKCLENCKYVAAILPASFMLHDDPRLISRLSAVIELSYQMFEDTETPVCLALFNEQPVEALDIRYYRRGVMLTRRTLLAVSQRLLRGGNPKLIKMNDEQGLIVLRAIDSAAGVQAHFTHATGIPFNKTTRAVIHCRVPDDVDVNDLIDEANGILNKWREDTHDLLLLAWRGLRVDGEYRRRVCFTIGRTILAAAYANLKMV